VLHATACSPFLARLLKKDAALAAGGTGKSAPGLPVKRHAGILAAQHIADEAGLKRALRLLRSQVMARIIVRDLNGLADLHEVMQTTSQLAECAINTAVDYLHAWLVAAYGQPVDAEGQQQRLIVIGMASWAAASLMFVRYRSDLCLCAEGETSGQNPLATRIFLHAWPKN